MLYVVREYLRVRRLYNRFGRSGMRRFSTRFFSAWVVRTRFFGFYRIGCTSFWGLILEFFFFREFEKKTSRLRCR